MERKNGNRRERSRGGEARREQRKHEEELCYCYKFVGPRYKYTEVWKTKIVPENYEKSTPRTGRGPACLPQIDMRVLPRRESTTRLRTGSPHTCEGAYKVLRIAITMSNTVMYGDDVVGVTTMSLTPRSWGRTSTNEDVEWSIAGLSRDLSCSTL